MHCHFRSKDPHALFNHIVNDSPSVKPATRWPQSVIPVSTPKLHTVGGVLFHPSSQHPGSSVQFSMDHAASEYLLRHLTCSWTLANADLTLEKREVGISPSLVSKFKKRVYFGNSPRTTHLQDQLTQSVALPVPNWGVWCSFSFVISLTPKWPLLEGRSPTNHLDIQNFTSQIFLEFGSHRVHLSGSRDWSFGFPVVSKFERVDFLKVLVLWQPTTLSYSRNG